MPIEFRCGQCGKLLRTGDDTAGKQAKCPSCGSIQAIPMSSQGAAPAPGAFPPLPSGLPDSPFQSQPTDPAASDPSGAAPLPSGFDPNPYASPAGGAAPFEFRGPSGPRTGPPWERDRPSASSFIATVKELFGSGTLFFDDMRREGGLGAPIGYALTGGMIGGMGGLVFQTILQMLLGAGMGNPFAAQMAGGAAGAVVGLACGAVILPIALIIGMFFSAGLYHLMLMMLGGARFPFETTFRVVAYCQGTTGLLSFIPFCGGLINAIVSIVYTIIGLSRAHEISGGKAALAVLIPMFVCCGIAVVFYGAIIAVVINQAR